LRDGEKNRRNPWKSPPKVRRQALRGEAASGMDEADRSLFRSLFLGFHQLGDNLSALGIVTAHDPLHRNAVLGQECLEDFFVARGQLFSELFQVIPGYRTGSLLLIPDMEYHLLQFVVYEAFPDPGVKREVRFFVLKMNATPGSVSISCSFAEGANTSRIRCSNRPIPATTCSSCANNSSVA
jgi:hypothetical protein